MKKYLFGLVFCLFIVIGCKSPVNPYLPDYSESKNIRNDIDATECLCISDPELIRATDGWYDAVDITGGIPNTYYLVTLKYSIDGVESNIYQMTICLADESGTLYNKYQISKLKSGKYTYYYYSPLNNPISTLYFFRPQMDPFTTSGVTESGTAIILNDNVTAFIAGCQKVSVSICNDMLVVDGINYSNRSIPYSYNR